MPAAEWSIERELCTLADRDSVEESLATLGLVPPNVAFVVEVTEGWWRSGDETYALRCCVNTGTTQQRLFLKACVAYNPFGSLSDILDSWVERRRLLSSIGIATPRLFGYGKGVLLEEDVPHELFPMLLTLPSHQQSILLHELARLAGKLALCGFCPIDPYGDLRSHGEDVVMIDFGQDLGAPYIDTSPSESLFARMIQRLHATGLGVSPTTEAAMKEIFEAASARPFDTRGRFN